MIFQTIQSHRSLFPVKKMCRVLGVSQSGYYAWRKRVPSNRARTNIILRQRIAKLYEEHGGAAGSPMITADLRAEKQFQNISRPRVARHMRSMGLRCKTVKKFVVTTDSKHKEPVAPNILNRKFSISEPNRVWVTDITYLKVGQKWNYLTVFIDLYSRAIVGWDLSNSLERHSVIHAFQKAINNRKPEKGLVVHSDRGIQYASSDFRKKLKTYKFVQSMSLKGNCWDNAVAESFFHTLKTQLIRHNKFKDQQEAELALFRYIEVYYNRRRRHSSNGWMSPAEYENRRDVQKLA
jgi:putative transposase